MPDKRNYLQVNWVDGMKINKNHFIAQEQAFSARLADVRQMGITPYNYGLLPVTGTQNNPLKINIYKDNQRSLRIKVSDCSAVTPGGSRISLAGDSQTGGFILPMPETLYEIALQPQEELFVVLSVNEYNGIPVGNPDPSEEPPRYPFIIPDCKVHLIAESQLGKMENGLNFLLIGKIRITEKGPEPVSDYIPPCTCVLSHPRLVEYHTGFDQFLSQLEVDLVTILRKISDKEQTNSLALTLKSVAEPLLNFLGTNILGFRWNVPFQPPLAMCGLIAQSARLIKNALDTCSGKSREELLNYLTEWCTLNQGDFENILTRTVNFNYQHSDMQKTLSVMMQYAEVLSPMFSKLSSLEYIGKKKETSIFVKEQPVKKSFLAD